VCERETERERERVCVCVMSVCAEFSTSGRDLIFVVVNEMCCVTRERASQCVCVCRCVCV